MPTRIAVITDDPGWHGRQLREAFATRGVESRFLSLTEGRFQIESETGLPITLPGFEQALPDGVFVRGVPGGTLEQVVLYLDLLHALALMGIAVYNDGRAIERTVDKAMTSFLLARAGIPTPACWVTSNASEARAIAHRELGRGEQLVSKPLFGSQGNGIRRHATLEEFDTLTDHQGVFYLQRYVHTGEQPHDFRVFVIAGIAVAAMRRVGVTWLNNVHQGAQCEPVHLDDRLLARLAEDATRTLEMHYAGVDIIRDEHGRYSVLEVNSIPAWKGLQKVTRISIAERLVEDFLPLCVSVTAPATQAS